MKDSAKAIWMRRRDGIEAHEDERLDLLPDEPTRALWSACPNPPPLDAAEVQAAFRRALEESGVRPRWWFMPRPVSLTFATCGGVFLAAFLAFGPSNGPSAWLPLIQSLSPAQNMAQAIHRPASPAIVAQAPPPATALKLEAPKAEAVKVKPVPPVRLVAAEPVQGTVAASKASKPGSAPAKSNVTPRTKPAPMRMALAGPSTTAQRSFLYVAVTKTEPAVTASITRDESSRGGYAKVTALRPNDNGVLVRTEATVTSTEPDPQVVTHVPSWAMGMNGLPAPMSTRTSVTVPAPEGDK